MKISYRMFKGSRKTFSPMIAVMKTSPASVVLQGSEEQSRCARCLKALGSGIGEAKGRRCSMCKRVYYCSKDCQERDWVEHRPECKVFSGNVSGLSPTRTIRLAARILHLMNRSGDKGEKLRRLVAELVHHNDERSQSQRDFFMSAASVVARLLVEGCGKRALSWPSASDHGFAGLVHAAYDLLGKLACNVFSITSEGEQEDIACGLYLEASVVNHSCRPNAVQTFHGRVLSMRCIRAILPGEEVTIGTTDLRVPGRIRRRALAETFFFLCRCERCNSEDDLVEDAILEGFACPSSKCRGLCTKKDRAEQGDVHDPSRLRQEDLFCRACGTSRSAGEAERVGEMICEQLKRMDACAGSGPAREEGRVILEGALKQATSPATGLHRANWMLSSLYARLVLVCINLQDFEAALRYALDALDEDRRFWSRVLPNSAVWGNELAVAGKEDYEGDAVETTETLVVEARESGKRLDALLGGRMPEQSRSYFGGLCRLGMVLLDGKPAKKSAKVEAGQEVEVRFVVSPELSLEGEDIPLDILFEDEDIIAVNKPAGMVVHPAPGSWNGTFVNALVYHLAMQGTPPARSEAPDGEHNPSLRPGIVHRLDKGTTGVLLAAKNPAMQAKLATLFAQREVRKSYLTVCVGNPGKAGVIDVPIGRHPIHRQRMMAVPSIQPNVRARRALSVVTTVAHDGKLSVAEVSIETGRTHQIRVHLQYRRTPVLGDDVYGNKDWNRRLQQSTGMTRPLLHAHTLEFTHPATGELVSLEAPLPPDVESVVRKLYPQVEDEHPGWLSSRVEGGVEADEGDGDEQEEGDEQVPSFVPEDLLDYKIS